VSNLPNQFRQTFNASQTTPNITLTNPFPESLAQASLTPNSIDQNLRTAYVQQWNLGIERELHPDLVLELGYIGSKGSKLRRNSNPNQAVLGAGTVNSRRPFPALGNIALLDSSASSIYHSMQLRLEKRFGSGLSFLSSYTWGKSIDDDSGTSGGGSARGAQDSYNLKDERGLSTFDSRHRLTFSYVYQLPVGAGRHFGANWPALPRYVAGGWELSGIVTLMSGRPFTPVISRDNSLTGNILDRPDLVGTAELDRKDPALWFNTSAFVIPPAGRFGNAGRNILTGPGTNTVDFSLLRNHRFKEAHNVQFRAELFNVFNHPNFALPNRTADSAQFGKIFGAGPARLIQFGLRYMF